MNSQSARVDGLNNIIVQVLGDGNSVVLGYAHLTLTRHLIHRTIVFEVGWVRATSPTSVQQGQF